MDDGTPSFKVSFVGDAGVGKTTWFHRHLTGEITKDYVPTVGCEVGPIRFTTVRGAIQLDVWDVSGSLSTHDKRVEYLKNSDAALIMFDYSRETTFDNVMTWYHELVAANSPDLPIVICGNKTDLDEQDREVKWDMIQLSEEMLHMQHYDISTLTNLHLEEPFLWMLRQILNDPDLDFVYVGCTFQGAPVDQELMDKYRREMEEAQWLPLPDEDDADL